MGGFIPQTFTQVFPFIIYNINNVSATAAQKKMFIDLGLNIDQFTFQIRSGLVGARSYLTLPEDTAESDLTGYPLQAFGNFEQQLFCPGTDIGTETSTDPFYYPEVANPGTSVILDDSQPTLLWGVTAGSPINTPATSFNQIVMNQRVSGNAQERNASAGFWLQIIDDPLNGIYANLMGQMFDYNQNPPRGLSPYPSGSNIVPLGVVAYSFNIFTNGFSVTTEQAQGGNLINRFPPTLGSFRGAWNALFAALPAGKTNLVFYPGDIVIDDTAPNPFASGSGVTSGNFYLKWIVSATAPLWLPVGSSPAVGVDWSFEGLALAP